MAYIRTMCIAPLLVGSRLRFGIDEKALGIPPSVFEDQMGLIPMTEATRWLEELETLSGDPACMINLNEYADSFRLGLIGQWFTSAPELSLTVRRINYGINNLQSGCSCYATQSGMLIKWCYDNSFTQGRGRLHDALRMLLAMHKVLQQYLGEDFVPRHVAVAGGTLEGGELEQLMGCEVAWNQPSSQIWLEANTLSRTLRMAQYEDPTVTLPLSRIDNLMNMPLDDPKVAYEMVNYLRHFGFPRLDTVAEAFGLSRQQFQRRLQDYGINFTNLVHFVLMHEATRYMLRGLSPAETARKLGYDNPQSFAKAFQRFRGLTPAQYLAQVVHPQGI